ncbi:GNAT family N-acetyltransferase [Parasphingorhabdus cellanae]|uniref:GNAT family N-acetyltransferase n=1 Tax=Parasphingorhabdus cellanae TaxID=2806553 RepID=A0ABX7T515_9SPHN|nr:GNAT family N-acetyltransferase [Parasphingorhabdus cellanae]QTD55078.1 GNAT family N-acetyltransferase [Parasphingorhabdus cellanae]
MADIIIETERLRLRNWRDEDIEPFMTYLNTPKVTRWLGGVQSREKFLEAVERIRGYDRDFGHTFWIVERKSDDALLGFCGLKRVNAPQPKLTGAFEIGWRLREDVWGQGYAREAATAAMSAAFTRHKAPFVVALTVSGNESSLGLMKRLGMIHRPELDFHDPNYGEELNPTIVYRIEAKDWKPDT